MTQVILLCLLTLVASGIGTATGFGTSTVMIPVMALFVPLPTALLFVGIIHLCGDIWKVLLFKRGLDWKLILGFGLSGIAASFLGATLSLRAQWLPLERILGAFLILYVLYLFLRPDWSLPKTNGTALCGGFFSGLFAGFFGVGGAVRGAFLAAFNLPKEVYIFTSGLIAMFIDITRISRYIWGGYPITAGASDRAHSKHPGLPRRCLHSKKFSDQTSAEIFSHLRRSFSLSRRRKAVDLEIDRPAKGFWVLRANCSAFLDDECVIPQG